ncbi:MAG: hypothetical protein JWP49_2206 [Phenylobacterium sp.]|jgi:hypothetical protein|nr:hypothetical protein [Phenylobacterium sp.]
MSSALQWVTLLGVVGPLATLAGSALAYVIKSYRDRADSRRRQFFELMQFIDGSGPLATKMAAIYQLREYKEHRAFIVRFCVQARTAIAGSTAQVLIAELDETRRVMS